MKKYQYSQNINEAIAINTYSVHVLRFTKQLIFG